MKADEEKRLNKAYRVVYKGNDTSKLTEEALNACNRMRINPDDLMLKNVEYF